MRSSCSSIVTDDFDDFNEKNVYSSTNNCLSLINDIQNNDFPFFDEFSESIPKKKDFHTDENLGETNEQKCVSYDPQLGNLIENELGLHDCQTSRKNAWGNLSYAELIAKAIENSYQQRLTLSQIYSWMIQYVPYFRDKADKKSSTGWKNSIRHNLSLHNCFVRIPNEIAGKSSWWTIDPRAKQIRGRKKVQSNENCTKNVKSHLNKSNNSKRFTSVRDLNHSFYHHLSTQTMPHILHDMLKSSSSQRTNNSNSIDQISLFNCKNELIPNESMSCYSTNDYEMVSSKLSEQLKTIDHSNPLFRRMVLTIMRHQMNKSQMNSSRDQILSTPPPSYLEHEQLNHNSTFDFDLETILDYQRTTFEDSSFHSQHF